MPETEAPNEGNPGPESTPTPTPQEEAPGGQGQYQPDQDYFDEKFDPASLDDALRPAYKQMRDAFSQKTQSIAEERRQLREAQEVYEALQDPERQAEALKRLGFDFEGDDEDNIYDDEPDPYEQRLAALEEALGQRSQQEQKQAAEQAEIAYINDGLTKLQQKTGREFTDDELQTLGDLSTVVRDAEGFPDVDAAYERIYNTVLPNERKRWQSQKDSPQAPKGAAASEVPDLTTEQGRVDYMTARLAETAD